jgi:hypothetical protein
MMKGIERMMSIALSVNVKIQRFFEDAAAARRHEHDAGDDAEHPGDGSGHCEHDEGLLEAGEKLGPEPLEVRGDFKKHVEHQRASVVTSRLRMYSRARETFSSGPASVTPRRPIGVPATKSALPKRMLAVTPKRL